MSRGVNKVILVGNLGKDPEVRHTQAGTAIANFSLATGERRKQGESWVDHTEWHNLVAFGKTAEAAGQHLRKGSRVYVEGRLQTRKWEKDGVTRYSTEVAVADLVFLDSGGAGASRPAEPAKPQEEAYGFDPNEDVPF